MAQAAPKALAVVTTNSLVDNSQSLIKAYVAQRRLTRTVFLVTEDKTNSANGTTTPGGWAAGIDLTHPPSATSSSERADAIRNWLRTNYVTRNIGDVLLIGDPSPVGGVLPMKNFFPYKNYPEMARNNQQIWDEKVRDRFCLAPPNAANYNACTQFQDAHREDDALPNDYYYSNLTYDWPLDADGEIVSIDNTDLGHQDVNVGRLPAFDNDIAGMNKALSKFIAYSTSTDRAWRKNGLLAMDAHGYTGSTPTSGFYGILGESTRNNVLTPNGYGSYRIYVPFKPDGCTNASCAISGDLSPVSAVNVGSVWAGPAWSGCQGVGCVSPKRNFGLVFWFTHGGPRGASNVINLDNASENFASALDDQHPAFVVSGSCSNLSPYHADNLGVTLLHNGAVAMLAASRISWPGFGDWGKNPYVYSASSTDVTYGFVKELITNKLPAGEAYSAARTHLWNAVMASMPVPDPTISSATFQQWDDLNWTKAQSILFTLFGDPTIGIDNVLTAPGTIPLPSDTPTNVVLSAGVAKTLYADNWPSKGNPWWTANVVLSVNSIGGKPIPSGTVWVNGVAYPIGGNNSYYQVVNIPDQGPYTITISVSAADTIQLTLANR